MLHKCFKVVREVAGGFYSLHSCVSERYVVEYAINLWTFPTDEKSKLFVFTDLSSARNFLKLYGTNVKIFEAECFGLKKATYRSFISYEEIEDFWHTKKLPYCTTTPPIGTYFTTAVKLIKEIRQLS